MNPAENYIINQPEPFQSILMHLQIIIEREVQNLELKYKWKLPYYYLNDKPFCFFNVTKGYVDVGFRADSDFDSINSFLISENRKLMKSLRYYKLEDINETILIEVLSILKTNYYKGFKRNI